jgi:hypothetical protein
MCAVFGCLPLAGQEKAVMRTDLGENVPNQRIELRAGGAMPDSMITYAATGEKSSKTLFTYNADGRITQEEISNWENSRWVNALKRVYEYDSPPKDKTTVGSITEYTWESGRWVKNSERTIPAAIDGIIYDSNSISWPSPVKYVGGSWFGFYGDWVDIFRYRVVSVNDSKGNPVSVEFHVYEIAHPDNSYMAYRYVISYNDRSQPVSVRGYNSDLFLWCSVDYRYDSAGNTVFFEELRVFSNGDIESHEKYTSANGVITVEQESYRDNAPARIVSKTDSDGNIYLKQYFTSAGGKMYMTHYDIYYPNSRTPSVDTGGNNPVGDTNKGGFDVNITVPADFVASGSFVIKFPGGFILDETNTRLSADFDGFALVITKQEDNSWLLELKPKGTRSVALRSEDVALVLAHIAYTVDGAVKRGTYDVTVHSIQFETPGGDAIVEPALTVPVQLNRWGVGNEAFTAPAIWSYGNSLHVRTPQPAALKVYTLSGALFRRQTLPAGETSISLPQGTYIVKIGSVAAKVTIAN